MQTGVSMESSERKIFPIQPGGTSSMTRTRAPRKHQVIWTEEEKEAFSVEWVRQWLRDPDATYWELSKRAQEQVLPAGRHRQQTFSISGWGLKSMIYKASHEIIELAKKGRDAGA